MVMDKIGLQEYESFSALNQFGKCEKLYQLSHDPTKMASGRFAATIIGSAIHRTIQTLHEEGALFDIEALLRDKVEEAILEREYEPVQWGAKSPYDKEGRIQKALRILTVYWNFNQNIQLRSSERWFFLEVDAGGPIHIRGRFDQIITDSKNSLIVRELKSGADAPDLQVLERDLQIPMEAYALRHGYIALNDIPYIPRDDANFHVHEWEPTDDKHIFKCKLCDLNVEHVGKFPDKVIYYDLGGLDPGLTAWKSGDRTPKRSPEIEFTFDVENWKVFQERLAYSLYRLMEAKCTGHFVATGCHGAMSPCDGCQYAAHCNSRVATVRTKILNPMEESE
jgi:hypothetical protein